MCRINSLVLIALASLLYFPHISLAQTTLSPGCEEVNDPRYDGMFTAASTVTGFDFYAGETLTIAAGEPTS